MGQLRGSSCYSPWPCAAPAGDRWSRQILLGCLTLLAHQPHPPALGTAGPLCVGSSCRLLISVVVAAPPSTGATRKREASGSQEQAARRGASPSPAALPASCARSRSRCVRALRVGAEGMKSAHHLAEAASGRSRAGRSGAHLQGTHLCRRGGSAPSAPQGESRWLNRCGWAAQDSSGARCSREPSSV